MRPAGEYISLVDQIRGRVSLNIGEADAMLARTTDPRLRAKIMRRAYRTGSFLSELERIRWANPRREEWWLMDRAADERRAVIRDAKCFFPIYSWPERIARARDLIAQSAALRTQP